ADDDLAFPGGQATAHRATAGVAAPGARHLRVVGPEQLAAAGIDGVGEIPGAAEIEHAVDGERRTFHALEGIAVEPPGQTQALDVPVIDLRERAEALFLVAAAPAWPVARILGHVQ